MRKTKREILNGIDCEKSRLVGNNTVEYWSNGVKHIRLHLTDIVTEKDGVFTLHTGGWHTPTTKDRINTHSPANLYQEKSIWFVFDSTGKYRFFDGIQVDSTGKVLNAKPFDDSELTKKNKLFRKLKKYSELCVKTFPIGEPSAGDCFICQFDFGEIDHIESHMREGYVVPTLVFKACKKYPIGQICMQAFIQSDSDLGYVADIAREQIGKSVYRYLKNVYGYAA